MFTSAGGGGVNKTSEERLSCWPRDWHRPRHRTLSVATMRKRDWPPSWIPPLSLSDPSSTHLRSPDIMQAYLDHVIHFASVSTVLCIFLSRLFGIVRLFSSRRVRPVVNRGCRDHANVLCHRMVHSHRVSGC